MLYSDFYNKWITTCMRCNLALINFDTSVNQKKLLREISNKKYYDYQMLKKYFIITKDMYEARSLCGYCINVNCKAFMKNQ